MGLFTFGAPQTLVLNIKQLFGIECFVETGTYKGETSIWASKNFKKVVTTEVSPSLYHEAKDIFSTHNNIEHYLGKSPSILRNLMHDLPQTIFWLDAHWSSGETAGEDDECPILAELHTIAPFMQKHVILIDDARYFLMPPPEPHKISKWPCLDDIIKVAQTGGQTYTFVYKDVIGIVPAYMRKTVADMLRTLE